MPRHSGGKVKNVEKALASQTASKSAMRKARTALDNPKPYAYTKNGKMAPRHPMGIIYCA